MRNYIIANDGITLCPEMPAAMTEGGIAGAGTAIRCEAAVEAGRSYCDVAPPRGGYRRRGRDRHGLAAAHGPGPLLRDSEEEARAHRRFGARGTGPGLSRRGRAGAGMSRALRNVTGCREALARLPELALSELRQQWRALYKSEASPHFSRELLLRAVAYRSQEAALGGLRPERQRQLRHIAQQFNETGELRRRARLELKSGTRLVREWQGRTYEVLVLDDGFSWQSTHYRSLSAVAKKITGTPWSRPLFFGLKQNRPATRRSSQPPYPAEAMESGDAAR